MVLSSLKARPRGASHSGEPRLDLRACCLAVAERDQVIGVPDHHRGTGSGIPGLAAGGLVADPGGLLQPVQRDIQRTGEITPPWGVPSSVGANPFPASTTPAFSQPGSCPWPGTTRAREKPGVINPVERRRQVGVQRPHPLGHRDLAHVVDRRDRVVAAAARPEPIRARLEPGLPLRFQRVTDPLLVTAVHQRGNSERAELRTICCLRDVHAPDRRGDARR